MIYKVLALACSISTYFLISLLILPFSSKAQDIAIGHWRVHLPYKDAIGVADAGDKVYCTSKSGLFSYDKSSGSVERLSKIEGLSDLGINVIRYHAGMKLLMIAYSNTNIDLLTPSGVINMSDIRRKNIPGKKVINNILFVNNFAYLSCGFGIVVIDLVKREVKDTYYIGPNGSPLEVNDLTFSGTEFFAATPDGIYKASASNPNLANYTAWTKMSGLPAGNYNTVCHYNNELFTSFHSVSGLNSDTVFVYNGSAWNMLYSPSYTPQINRIETSNNRMIVVTYFTVEIFDENKNRVKHIYDYSEKPNGDEIPRQAQLDASGTVWIADMKSGLVRFRDASDFNSIYPNGPETKSVTSMLSGKNNLWVAAGSRNSSWGNNFSLEGAFLYKNNNWSWYSRSTNVALDTMAVYDIVNITFDPSDEEHVYLGTWGVGIIELQNGVVTGIINEKNSSLKSMLRIGGIAFDSDGNMWITDSDSPTPLTVRKKDGSWQSYNLGSVLIGVSTIGGLVVDQFDQKWIVLPRGHGIVVFNDNNTLSVTSDDRVKKLTDGIGNGALPGLDIQAVAIDLDGEIWVGTDKGVGVFYSPEAVFSGGNFDAQRILIEQDGHTQYLLESEVVTAIAVDGANRKWIGTQNAGVFLMSPDGTKQILHFDISNSPLLSNAIYSIAINNKTGEVFFGTANGIISYRAAATEGEEEFNNVYIFPNPVRENYEGLIAITGLVSNVNIKITDVSGNLVYETKADGGQATWSGKNFKGEKARTGVYLVFCSNDDGSKTFVTKLLIIN
jgi:hypothetical protein